MRTSSWLSVGLSVSLGLMLAPCVRAQDTQQAMAGAARGKPENATSQPVATAASPTRADRRFLQTAAQIAAYQRAAAEKAMARARTAEVRAYAEAMMPKLGEFTASLQTLVHDRGLDMPTSLAAKDQDGLYRLDDLSAAGFESFFVFEAQRSAGELRRLFQRTAGQTRDPGIAAFIDQFRGRNAENETQIAALHARPR